MLHDDREDTDHQNKNAIVKNKITDDVTRKRNVISIQSSIFSVIHHVTLILQLMMASLFLTGVYVGAVHAHSFGVYCEKVHVLGVYFGREPGVIRRYSVLLIVEVIVRIAE